MTDQIVHRAIDALVRVGVKIDQAQSIVNHLPERAVEWLVSAEYRHQEALHREEISKPLADGDKRKWRPFSQRKPKDPVQREKDHKAAARAYYKEHKEEILAQQRAHYAAHKEDICRRQRQRRAEK